MRKTFFLFFFVYTNVFTQTFPNWFLDQTSIDCQNVAVGFFEKSYIDSSAITEATINAVESLAKQKYVLITSNKSFWKTGLGNAMMENSFSIEYDTSLILSLLKNVLVIDTFISKDFVAVLVSTEDCKNFETESIDITEQKEPNWVSFIPEDKNYFYTIGAAPKYYFFTSTIYESEKSAYLSLAEIKKTSIKALQKNSTNEQFQEMQTTNLDVQLFDIQIVKRWYNEKNKIFYVLAKMPKQ